MYGGICGFPNCTRLIVKGETVVTRATKKMGGKVCCADHYYMPVWARTERKVKQVADKAENITEVTDDGWNTVVEPYADTFDFASEGATLMGTYTGKREVEQEGLDGKPRTVNVYEVQDSSGKKWSVWGSYNIDDAFSKINEGQAVKIVFEGIANLDGGRTVKKFTVLSK